MPKHNGGFVNNAIIAENEIVCNVSVRHLLRLLLKYSQRNGTIKLIYPSRKKPEDSSSGGLFEVEENCRSSQQLLPLCSACVEW